MTKKKVYNQGHKRKEDPERQQRKAAATTRIERLVQPASIVTCMGWNCKASDIYHGVHPRLAAVTFYERGWRIHENGQLVCKKCAKDCYLEDAC